MQQFVVPQFIDVEDKIFGPITTRQFLILLASALIVFLAFRFGDFAMFVVILILFGGGSLILAFVKINGQNFHMFLLNIFQTLKKPSLRIWNKELTHQELDYYRKLDMDIEIVEKTQRKEVKHAHIKDLSLVVNTGGYYKPEDMEW